METMENTKSTKSHFRIKNSENHHHHHQHHHHHHNPLVAELKSKVCDSLCCKKGKTEVEPKQGELLLWTKTDINIWIIWWSFPHICGKSDKYKTWYGHNEWWWWQITLQVRFAESVDINGSPLFNVSPLFLYKIKNWMFKSSFNCLELKQVWNFAVNF